MEISSDFQDIDFPEKLNVTGQEIDISFLNSTQKNFYINLFKEVLELYSKKQKPRVVIGFAGPSGSGKSVITALFEEFIAQQNINLEINTVGIDAFSYPNEYLLSHTDSNGEILKKVKGRFDTYNVKKLTSALQDFQKGKDLSLPVYSRITHDPIENVNSISKTDSLLLVEGLWLLYDEGGWEEVGKLLDYCIFVDAHKDKVREMVVERHKKGGRSLEEATAYYDEVDASNFDIVSNTKYKADKVIAAYYELSEVPTSQ